MIDRLIAYLCIAYLNALRLNVLYIFRDNQSVKVVKNNIVHISTFVHMYITYILMIRFIAHEDNYLMYVCPLSLYIHK